MSIRRALTVSRRSSGLGGNSLSDFEPVDLPGCVLWLRADLGITLATGVSSWADQSGAGNTVTQATGAKQPTYNASDAAYNGKPTLSFLNASAQVLTNVPIAAAQTLTIAVVGESDSSAISGAFVDTVSGGGIALYAAASTLDATMYAGTALGGTATVGSKSLTAAVYSGASSNLYVSSSSVPVATGAAGAGQISSIAIGGNNVLASPLTGKIAEVVVYNSGLTLQQRQLLFAYFAARYAGAWS